MNIIHTTEIVKNVNKLGRAKFWQGRVYTENGKVYTQPMSWQELSDGRMQDRLYHTETEVRETKSQATLEDQAIFNINSDLKKQKDKISTDARPLPMLAKEFLEHEAKIKFPAYVQPKWDGYRMLQRDQDSWSRKGIDQVKECVGHLLIDTDQFVLDGEVMLLRPFLRQHTRGAATRYDAQKTPHLNYFAYDMILADTPFSERIRLLEETLRASLGYEVAFHDEDEDEIKRPGETNQQFTDRRIAAFKRRALAFYEDIKNPDHKIHLTPTFKILNKEEGMALFKIFRELGEEGIMFRNADANYGENKRVTDLQKLKEFIEAEFEVVDVVCKPKRPDEGMLVISLGEKDGKPNTQIVNIEGGFEENKRLLRERDTVVGQIWTVKFQKGLTKDGKLQFATGVVERDINLDGEPNMFVTGMGSSLLMNNALTSVDEGGSSDDDDSEAEVTIEAPKKSAIKPNPKEDVIMGEIIGIDPKDNGYRFLVKHTQGTCHAASNASTTTMAALLDDLDSILGQVVQVRIQGWDGKAPTYPFVFHPFKTDAVEPKTKPEAPKVEPKAKFVQTTIDSLFD